MKTLLFFIFILLVLPVFSQKNNQKATKAKVSSKTIVTTNSREEFSRDLDKIPDNFKGHDAKAILEALAPKLKSKDEFENTIEYRQRVEKTVDGKLLGNLNGRSNFAVSGNILAQESVYDADKKVFHLKLLFLSPVAAGNPEFEKNSDIFYIKLGEKILEQSKYVGSNSLGIKRDITKQVIERKRLVLGLSRQFEPEIKTRYIPSVGKYVEIDLNLEPSAAKILKGNLIYIFSYKLVFPYTYYGLVDLVTPKINNPVDVTVNGFDLYGKIDGCWIFNKLTGEIVFKKVIEL